MKPPDDLKSWSKNNLVREVQRLRAVLHEHTERRGADPREQSTSDAILDLAGDPNTRGGALVDARNAVLLEGIDVVLIDTKHEDPISMMLVLSGRVNYADDRAEHAYLLGPDGAAGLASELMMLSIRAGLGAGEHGRRFHREFTTALNERMEQ